MAALCANDSSFHTADTAADNSNRFLHCCGSDLVFLGLHYAGNQCAACQTSGVAEVLIICVSFVAGEVEAAVVAADTRSDVLQTVFDQLGDPLAVSQELTGNTHTVDLAFCDSLGAHFGLHTACADYGDIYELLDVSYVGQVAVLRHVLRGMSPVPGVICTVVTVEHVVTCILQMLYSLLTLSHVTADFGVLFAGNCAHAEIFHLGLYGITERYREILAAGSLDGLYDISCETITVLKGAAVLVGTLVGVF